MTAAENRRRVAALQACEGVQAKTLACADSAEMLAAAALFPKIGSPAPRGGGVPFAGRRLELRRG